LIQRADHSRALDQAAPEVLRRRAVPQTKGEHPQAAAALRSPGARCSGGEAKYRDSGQQAWTAKPVPGKPPKLTDARGAARTR
jgi:hypothetical protein